ncbi:MAG: CPBP family intramembrane metalloprotease [Sphingobacteriaceae bacterium]|nr:MAG: CPBP family intramembrane metalloprotease [Sphingobacteriaceae bacterium]
MIEKPYYQMSYALQFLLMILLSVGGLILGMLVCGIIVVIIYGPSGFSSMLTMSDNMPASALNSLKIIQMGSSVFGFLIPSIFFAKVIVRQPIPYLKANWHFPLILLLAVFFIMLVSTPLMEVLITYNQKMIFPPFLKGVERWMRNMEDTAGKQTEVLLQMKTPAAFLVNLLMIAILPAVSEEFIFRGCFLQIFTGWTKSLHWGVWLSAALFSFIHFQFFGFLPRMLLGVFFGYFAAWSGSIWPGVLGHFLNNGIAVIASYLYQNKLINVNPDQQQMFDWKSYTFSLILTLILFLTYKKLSESKRELLAA